MTIRLAQQGDIPDLQVILDATALFPSEMLLDMIAPFLRASAAEDLWLSDEQDGTVRGFYYARPEELADGTWNMLAIAVDPTFQCKGSGARLALAMEQHLQRLGARILIVDTSGTDEFARARAFYANNGYDQEARIRDFWGAGDDKVIFRKAL